MKVVVVESPAKAKTINKYLGGDYTVLASYGHIRDLPSKDGSVRPDEDFAMTWQADPRAEKQIKAIAQAVKGADHLYLATDPDREGEAISWHVQRVLEERKMLDGIDVKRVVFNEVTKGAVLHAMANPRELDDALIDAYLARRALDYLVGFKLSPVLWRKLPGARSAGRVQSVALRLISEREAEIEVFKPQEYWTIDALLDTPEGKSFTAHLTHLDGKKLDKFDLGDEAAAKHAEAAVNAGSFSVTGIERKRVRRNPQPPFTTSTLQQEASRKLGLSATNTMRAAQKLYEGIDLGGETVGLITYMRTDGVQMSQEAIGEIRGAIASDFGQPYVPDQPRIYKTRAKNAQEAHEAIRPTSVGRTPAEMARHLDKDMARLYELVWKRAVASQMASAELDQTAVTIEDAAGRSSLRATGSIIAFDGFLKLYVEDRDDPSDDDGDGRRLPQLAENDALKTETVTPEQHFTQPPPRYSEASLVKKLEELGIGRPSTYASIMQVLQDRDYVRLDRRRFIPEDRGRLVTVFLENFFNRYVQYNFTAEMEAELDEISAGKLDWRQVLRKFWETFSVSVEDTTNLKFSEVLDALDKELAPHFFPTGEDGEPARACQSCGDGRLGLKLGKFGAFIGCSNYPECRYTRQLGAPGDGDGGDLASGPRVLGDDPVTSKSITLRKGPYGFYVQLGEQEEGSKAKPKRASISKGTDPETVDLKIAIGLLALPREVGAHPEDGAMILAGLGRFGPYLKHGDGYVSIPKDDDVLTIGLNRAVDLIASHVRKKPPAKKLGEMKGKPVTVQAGRYGPYVQSGKIRATLPKELDKDAITLEDAIALIEAKAGKAEKPKAAAKKAPAKKAAAKKTKAKKTTTKKPAAKAEAPQAE